MNTFFLFELSGEASPHNHSVRENRVGFHRELFTFFASKASQGAERLINKKKGLNYGKKEKEEKFNVG